MTANGVGTCGADDNQSQAGHIICVTRGDALRDGDGDGASSRQSLIAVTSLAVAGDFSSGEDIAQTVRAANGQPGCIADDTIVRRLTPLECERLQGFPDDWTFGSDAQRYRQLGNSLAVPVVEWIARRLIAVDEVVA